MVLLAAGFLTALLLLVVPWWLHRRESASTTPQPVASLFLLREAAEPQARRKVIRYRLLLLLRMLLLTLLAVAFAQPVIERFVGSDSVTAATARLVVVDVSASMAALWPQAREQAEELLEGRAALVAAGSRLELLTELTEDPAEHQAGLRALNVSAASVTYDGLPGRLSSIADALVDAGEPLEVHLISDFQASRVPERFNALVAGATRPVVLHPLTSSAGNWFIESFNAESLIVRGVGTKAAEVPVQIFADGALLLSTDVSIEADGRTALAVPGIDSGRHDIRLTARLQVDDALALDNVRYHVLPQRSERNTRILADAVEQRVYVDAALTANGWESRGDDPSGYPLIALDPKTGGVMLAGYLEKGGRALVFSGDYARANGRLPVSGNVVISSVNPTAGQRVTVVQPSHPLLRTLSGWEDVLVYQHLNISDPPGRVLLALDDGSPLLLEIETGRGRALVFTTSLAPDWSNLGATPVFVNLVRAALEYLSDEMLPVEVVAGTQLQFPPGNTQIIATDGSRLLTLQQSQGLEPVVMETPGHYEVRSASTGFGRRYLAVNVSPLESALPPIPSEMLERWQNALVSPATAEPPLPAAREVRSDLPLAPWLLLALLILALLEPVFANGGFYPRRAATGGNR